MTKSNILIFTRMKQPTLTWPREDQGEGEKKEERKTELPESGLMDAMRKTMLDIEPS